MQKPARQPGRIFFKLAVGSSSLQSELWTLKFPALFQVQLPTAFLPSWRTGFRTFDIPTIY